MTNKHSAILLLLIFLCAAVRLFNFIGIGTNDDIFYIQTAQAVAWGNSPLTSQIGYRSGMILPLALLYKFFGMNEAAFAAYPLACSLVTCILIYLTALRLWGMTPAVFAALLWIAFPLQIVFDTQLSPSNQHASCVAAALFCYSFVAKPVFSPTKWKEAMCLIPAGIFLGLAWLVNEIFVTFIIIIIPFFIIVRPKFRHVLLVTAGFACVFISELFIIRFSTGSFFSRFTAILETERVITSNKDAWYLPRTLFKVLNANPVYEEGHFGIIWHLFIFITAAAFFLKDKLAAALSLGCWLWLAYLQWGIQSPEGTPIARYIRYFSMIVPLQCLVFGMTAGWLCKYSTKLKCLTIILFAALLLNLSWFGTKAVNLRNVHTEDYRAMARLLLNLNLESDDKIYTDFLSGDFLEVYTKGRFKVIKANLEGKNIFNEIAVPEKGILIQDGSRAVVEIARYRDSMPQWYLSPPEHWQLLTVITGKHLDVYAAFDPKIYKILPSNRKEGEN